MLRTSQQAVEPEVLALKMMSEMIKESDAVLTGIIKAVMNASVKRFYK